MNFMTGVLTTGAVGVVVATLLFVLVVRLGAKEAKNIMDWERTTWNAGHDSEYCDGYQDAKNGKDYVAPETEE